MRRYNPQRHLFQVSEIQVSYFPKMAVRDLTQKIKTVAKVMDLVLLDHLIITLDGHSSFADEGVL